ncbi:hyaluronidase-2-like [Nerophis ophidion]|uniref:hyaluronidase-2-like n=1 Tax=Nerophis ophidion TaxID=159077 RepID=UPI002ADF93A4|nr:hyaluronidase-2-like [Nerophis ophidion]
MAWNKQCRTNPSVPSCSTVPLSLLVLLLAGPSTAGPPRPARPPLLSGQPFIIFWAIPDSSCSARPDPGSFGMEREGRVVVFFEDTLGNYPYFLHAALPAPRYLGLGVLRWSEWPPQWLRNREKKAVYQAASRNLLKAFFPNWTPEEVEKWSQTGRRQQSREEKHQEAMGERKGKKRRRGHRKRKYPSISPPWF